MLSKEGPFSVFSCSVNEFQALKCLVVFDFLKSPRASPCILRKVG